MFIDFDLENRPVGFYQSDYAGDIPVTAIEFTEDEGKAIYSIRNTHAYIDGNFVDIGVRPVIRTVEDQAEFDGMAEVEADALLQQLKNVTPQQAYDYVMAASPSELQQILARVCKYIAFKHK